MTEQERGYHHGALKAALLAEGRRLLLEDGEHAVSLRELARRTGVSHAAPLRHFADREALLDEIAADGFDELKAELDAAGTAGDPSALFVAYAKAHVRYAQQNGPLVSMMFTRLHGHLAPGSVLAEASIRFLRTGAAMLNETETEPPGVLRFLIAGTLEGIAALAAAGRIPSDRLDEVADAAAAMLVPLVLARRDFVRTQPDAAPMEPGA